MYRSFAASAVIAFALVTVAAGQLSCKSQLRLLPQFQHLFQHCCEYGEWTEWSEVGTTQVPTSQCSSGKVVNEERRQTDTNGICDDNVESRVNCTPGVRDELILALGLGSSGYHITPNIPLVISNNNTVAFRPNNRSRRSSPEHSSCDEADQVCLEYTVPHRIRYGREALERPHINKRRSTADSEPEPLSVDPTPFNIREHGSRYRRQTDHCYPDGIQHILFVLDTSGSIGTTQFRRLTDALSFLTVLFCRPIKIAVLTFNQDYYVEFCFNCFDNTCGGRVAAGNRIKDIQYRGGWTHTAGAAQCVCNSILNETCGLHPEANCIDVVFITDGRSNDPKRKVCKEIECLHERGINTFAIGITDYVNQEELECIANNALDPNEVHLFNFDSFEDFEAILYDIVNILTDPDPDNEYVCADPTTIVGTEGCTF